MTLSQAKLIADHPDLSAFTLVDLTEALERLRALNVSARMTNVHNERTLARYERRVERLQDEIEAIRNQDEARRI